MADLQKYINLLKEKLEKLYHKYKTRLRENNGNEHKHLPDSKKSIIIGISTTIGTALGSVVPGVGNVVGAAIGTVLGGTIVGITKVHYARINKKIDNADNVTDVLDQKDTHSIFEEAAKKVIENREAQIMNLKDTRVNAKIVTKYLAVNMMAALKKYSDNCHTQIDIEDTMVNGVEKKLSKKVPSVYLLTEDNKPMTLASLAKPSLR